MIRLRSLFWLFPALVLLSSAASSSAQEGDPPESRQLAELLDYLDSAEPEHRLAAERRLKDLAEANFDSLVHLMNRQEPEDRPALLGILASTRHPGVLPLCVDALCRPQALRQERVIALEVALSADDETLLALLKGRLSERGASVFERVQGLRLLGFVALPQAHSLAEEIRDAEAPESLPAAFAEDALLRSLLRTPYAEHAWDRYRKRHPEAPGVKLGEIQDLLADLSAPLAAVRAEAEGRLIELIGDDARLLLALARSERPEQAAFALATLRERTTAVDNVMLQALALDLASVGEQTAALLAVDLAIAASPPTPEELERLRPVVSADAMARLEAILDRLGADSSLVQLREQRLEVEMALAPLLRRNGAADDEVAALMARLAVLNRRLEAVEKVWRGGWRHEFEADILGLNEGR